MTAQIGDIYKHKGKEYSIIALTSQIPFNPADYGMEPNMRTTACYRGYWCQYNIDDDMLKLDKLFLFNLEGKYPPINGIEAEPEEYQELMSASGKKIPLLKNNGHRVYSNINLLIPYTGKILLGDGFINDYYVHMGYQQYWAYKKVIEFVFEAGHLVKMNDYSDIAQKQREYIKEKKIDPRYPALEDVSEFVENSFSLDYGIKANFFDHKDK